MEDDLAKPLKRAYEQDPQAIEQGQRLPGQTKRESAQMHKEDEGMRQREKPQRFDSTRKERELRCQHRQSRDAVLYALDAEANGASR